MCDRLYYAQITHAIDHELHGQSGQQHAKDGFGHRQARGVQMFCQLVHVSKDGEIDRTHQQYDDNHTDTTDHWRR
jgi:hypothetical protein